MHKVMEAALTDWKSKDKGSRMKFAIISTRWDETQGRFAIKVAEDCAGEEAS